MDGTNTTLSRRNKIAKILSENVKHKYQLIWIESVCDNEQQIHDNICKVKIHGLDYANMSNEEAHKDFEERIKKYEKCYVSLSKDEGYPFVRINNVG